MTLRRLAFTLGLLIFGWMLVGLATAPAQSKDMTGAVRVSVVPFSIEPQPFPGAPTRPDEIRFLQRLSEEATKQAQRSLIEHRLADAAEQVPSRDAANGLVVVTGTIKMPISLPPNIIGWNGAHRHGTFATATVTVTDAIGNIISKQQVSVNWDEVWWFSGGKSAHNYALDEVLSSMARKAADHGVRRLDRKTLLAAR